MHGMLTHTKERIDGSSGSVVVLLSATSPNEMDGGESTGCI